MCIFCDVESIEELMVSETKHSVALCNKFPICEDGHFLIIPRRHAETLLDLTKEEQVDLFDLLSRFMQKVEELIVPEGINVLFNRGMVAGQTVPHFHIHIICRYQEDGISNFKKENGSRPETTESKLEYMRKLFG
jgi:histidine triad (HIT) family protein